MDDAWDVRELCVTETWLQHPTYDRYDVSTMGRVRSRDSTHPFRGSFRTSKGKILKPWLNQSGYATVGIYRNDGPALHKMVHHLVLETYVGMRPDREEGRHLDDDRLNNALLNLKWGTQSENNLDRVANGIHHNAVKTHCPYGHEYTDLNTLVDSKGARNCRTCKRESNARYKRNKRSRAAA